MGQNAPKVKQVWCEYHDKYHNIILLPAGYWVEMIPVECRLYTIPYPDEAQNGKT